MQKQNGFTLDSDDIWYYNKLSKLKELTGNNFILFVQMNIDMI